MTDSRTPTSRSRIAQLLGGKEAAQPFPLTGWIALIAISVGLLWASVPSLVAFYEMPIGIAFAVATVQCASITLAPRLPRATVALQIAAIVYLGIATRLIVEELWPLYVPTLLSLTTVLVVIGLRETWIFSVAAWWLCFFAMVLLVAIYNWIPGRSEQDWGINTLVSVTVTLVALAVSITLGQRHRVRAVLAAARRDVELEQALRLGAEERARIARELHDVVAHSMSIVHIQAESAQYRVADLDPAAAREFSDIAKSARSASVRCVSCSARCARRAPTGCSGHSRPSPTSPLWSRTRRRSEHMPPSPRSPTAHRCRRSSS